ncbi:MAG: hypothetical protein R3C99_16215 [Pirellulaceae bacterium]
MPVAQRTQPILPIYNNATRPALESLRLDFTAVSDLTPLVGLGSLKVVRLAGSAVAAEAVAKFQSMRRERGLPDVELVAWATTWSKCLPRRIELEIRMRSRDGEAARYEADYRQALIRKLDKVELFGADVSLRSSPIC